jgi:hypothetical protein
MWFLMRTVLRHSGDVECVKEMVGYDALSVIGGMSTDGKGDAHTFTLSTKEAATSLDPLRVQFPF